MASACSSPPTSPSEQSRLGRGQPQPSLALNTTPVSPADGATVPYFGAVELVAANVASQPDDRVVLLRFELASSSDFAAPFFTATVPQAPGDRTGVVKNLDYLETRTGQTVY